MSRRKKKRPFNKRRDPIPRVPRPALQDRATPQNAATSPTGFGEGTKVDTRGADDAPPLHYAEVVDRPVLYDEALLDVCRTRWQLADWDRLADIDPDNLLHHPQRARIALLVAAAHWQLGQTQQAQRHMQRALDWGASRRQIAQVLISGIHHSLACAYMTVGELDDAKRHDLESLRLGGVPGDVELLAAARLQRATHGR